MNSVILPYDRDALRAQFQVAQPFRFFKIENFLDPVFVRDLVSAYPSYAEARGLGGKEFSALNEKFKIQITDSGRFPGPVKRLADVLNGRDFLADLEHITGIPALLPDPAFGGGGMHLTNASGRLDVHVDFNFHNDLVAHRRLNILLYLNPEWDESWGGNIELWDRDVRKCCHSYAPILNRCVVFETTSISYHGVTTLKCPPDIARKSFAAYYYTKEPPSDWAGDIRSTMFRARPEEKIRGALLMPVAELMQRFGKIRGKAKAALRRVIGP